jgi:hypothetical protein
LKAMWLRFCGKAFVTRVAATGKADRVCKSIRFHD